MRNSLIDFEKARDCCFECAKPIRKIDNFELIYNKEKLIFDCFRSTEEIDPLEIPDVAGALLDAAKGVSSYLQESVGQTFEICIRSGQDFQHNVVICPLNDELACVLIAEESIDILREQISKNILSLKHTFLSSSPKKSESSTRSRKVKVRDEIPERYTYSELFPDKISSPFLLIHGRISRMEQTPLVIEFDRTFRMPIPRVPVAVDFDMEVHLKSNLTYFIDRARIFIEFILREQKEAWTLTLIGTMGIVHAEIYSIEDRYYVLIGGAKKGEPRKITAWVNRTKDLLLANKGGRNAGIFEQGETEEGGNKLDKEKMPGEREKRVFIGGNYDFMAVIRNIEACVKETGFQPIVAFDFDVKLDEIHDEDLRLLHNCKFAIFDITHPAGELMEIERAKDYGIDVLTVYQVRDPRERKPPPDVTSMVKTLKLPAEGYASFEELREIIRRWLESRKGW